MDINTCINLYIDAKAIELAITDIKNKYKDKKIDTLLISMVRPVFENGELISSELIKEEYDNLIKKYKHKISNKIMLQIKKIINNIEIKEE
jgi:hypothetical protein